MVFVSGGNGGNETRGLNDSNENEEKESEMAERNWACNRQGDVIPAKAVRENTMKRDPPIVLQQG